MIWVHILLSLLSYAAFLTAFIAGILFLVQERQLKRKTMGVLFHNLPSLGALDRLNFRAIGLGFALFSLGLLFGFVQVRVAFGHWWMADPKTYLAIIVWMTYLGLWLLRLRSTLRGRRVALLSILGFSLVLFTFLESSYIKQSSHPYL